MFYLYVKLEKKAFINDTQLLSVYFVRHIYCLENISMLTNDLDILSIIQN